MILRCSHLWDTHVTGPLVTCALGHAPNLDSGPGLVFHTCCPQCRIHMTVRQPELGSAELGSGSCCSFLFRQDVESSLRSPADTRSLLWPICGPTPYVRDTHFQVPGVVERAGLWGFPGQPRGSGFWGAGVGGAGSLLCVFPASVTA